MTFRHGILGGRRRYSGGVAPEPEGIISIISPTQNQEVQGDFILSFELNLETISIISPTQNQEIEGDINFEFNLE